MLQKFKRQFQRDGEIYLRIKVRPNAAKTEVKAIMDDETAKIDIAAKPEKGKANAELIKFLAREFAVDKDDVKIIGGAGERVKLAKICR